MRLPYLKYPKDNIRTEAHYMRAMLRLGLELGFSVSDKEELIKLLVKQKNAEIRQGHYIQSLHSEALIRQEKEFQISKKKKRKTRKNKLKK